MTTKLRRACFDRWKYQDALGRMKMDCHLCGDPIDPVREEWEAEHIVRRAAGGSDDVNTNVKPAHATCHKPKTARDITENSKGKRVSDRHYGIKRSRGFGHPHLRKKLNGEVVPK